MGSRGPRPTPTAILEARNSWRAKLRTEETENPEYVVVPPMPDWMSDAAKLHWVHIAPTLLQTGVITESYATAFALLCETLATYTASRNGDDEKAMWRAHDKMFGMLREFGLTPASRAEIAQKKGTIYGTTKKPKTPPEADVSDLIKAG